MHAEHAVAVRHKDATSRRVTPDETSSAPFLIGANFHTTMTLLLHEILLSSCISKKAFAATARYISPTKILFARAEELYSICSYISDMLMVFENLPIVPIVPTCLILPLF